MIRAKHLLMGSKNWNNVSKYLSGPIWPILFLNPSKILIKYNSSFKNSRYLFYKIFAMLSLNQSYLTKNRNINARRVFIQIFKSELSL